MLTAPEASRHAYRYATIPFEHRDCDLWPQACLPSAADILEKAPRLSLEQAEERAEEMSNRFDRLSRAIRSYMSSGSLKDALQEGQCSRETFYRQLNRCLMLSPIGTSSSIVGWPGLIAGLRLKGYSRINDGAGTAGQFQRWLQENERWRELLHKSIRQGNGGAQIPGRKPDRRGVTRNFIKAFRAVIPLGVYPHDGKSNARGAIDRYIKEYVAMHQETTAVWFGEDVARKQHLGTGPQSFNLAVAPFDVVGTDAHTVDAIGIVIIPGPAGPTPVPVTRIQIVATVCHGYKAVSGYSVCIRPQIKASAVEDAYAMGMTPWKPMPLTIKGLTYDQGAGFPCGSIEGITEICPALVRLDNASQHFADAVRTHLRKSLGCAVVWGGVGHWWRNAVTERFFGTLERYGFQRVPSSMGTGPNDPHRAASPSGEAIAKGITWDELIQLVDVLIANYNAKPHKALGGISPLEAVRMALTGRQACWLPRIRPPHTANSPTVGVTVLRGHIAGSIEQRTAPYVEILGPRYTNDTLSKHYDWLKRPVYVYLPKDIRECEAYLATGEFIGTLKCRDKRWSLSPHSLQLRQAVNSLVRAGELGLPSGCDAVVVYADHLAMKAVEKAGRGRAPGVVPEASALADLQHSTGVAPTPARRNQDAANTSRFTASQRRQNLPRGWQ